MSSVIRDPKDFWSGVIFIVFGLFAVIIASEYSMGTAGRMGPAYFPRILGAILSVIGAVAIVRSLLKSGEALEKFAIKKIFLILLSVLLFAILVRGAGLFIGVLVLVMVSGYASLKFRIGPFLAVAGGLAVFSVLVFVMALGLPMPLFGPWLGF